ncbi:ABC transporter ATP-binding protein [Algoriphagus aestuarii]|nr:ABC transporter ATP-binding protein [Algoriphagus aestuarii]
MKNPSIIGRNLTLGYQKGKLLKEVVESLDFELYAGELTCLLGPNGVGKSTLIKAILGQLPPWNGELLIDQKEVSTLSISELAKTLAVVLTDPVFPGNMTVGQLVALGRVVHTDWTGRLGKDDKIAVKNALSLTKIGYLENERLSEISDGQRQKAMIARALAQDSGILILDEPTAHLDLVNRYEIMHLLREISHKENKAVLVVTHDLEIAIETADQFWILNCGIPLISGIPEELVISGKINHLLPGEKFHFDVDKGRIKKKSEKDNWKIIGDPVYRYWVKKALEKAEVNLQESQIQVNQSPFSVEFEGKSFATLRDFISFLIKK